MQAANKLSFSSLNNARVVNRTRQSPNLWRHCLGRPETRGIPLGGVSLSRCLRRQMYLTQNVAHSGRIYCPRRTTCSPTPPAAQSSVWSVATSSRSPRTVARIKCAFNLAFLTAFHRGSRSSNEYMYRIWQNFDSKVARTMMVYEVRLSNIEIEPLLSPLLFDRVWAKQVFLIIPSSLHIFHVLICNTFCLKKFYSCEEYRNLATTLTKFQSTNIGVVAAWCGSGMCTHAKVLACLRSSAHVS